MPAPTYPAYFTASGQTSHTVATAVDGYALEYPYGERAREAVAIRQTFRQTRSDYVRPAANAANCPAFPSARFCEDSGFRDVGCGVMEWSRLWAVVPPQVVDYETFAYTFPGFASNLSAYGRVPLSAQITSKLVHDFFLVGPGGTYADAGSITVYFGQTYTYGPYSGEVAAEYLSALSTPTLIAYQALVTTDAAAPASYSIEAHDSILEPWLGNIWRRTRRFVKAR